MKPGSILIPVCSLGSHDKATGQRTIQAMRIWLKESGRVIKKPLYGDPSRVPRIIYNTASPREMAGANLALRQWRSNIRAPSGTRTPLLSWRITQAFSKRGERVGRLFLSPVSSTSPEA